MALIEGCKHSLEITVPETEVDQEAERAAAAIQVKVRLPGFRPGKAPLAMVKTRFASDIRQEVLEKLVPRFLNAAFEQDHLNVVSQPNISDVHFHKGEPLKFKAEFEVAPVFELGEYQGLTVSYAEPVASEEDVNSRLEALRERKAEYVNEEPRALADSDYAVVSLESLSGVDEKVQQDELMLKLGDEATMPAFTENLRGASPDEAREFEVTYPADYDRETLAGRTVRFKATVKAVRRKELPELNDDFAKDLGDYQTLDELKDSIRKTILHEREHQAQDETKQQIIAKLVDTHPFAVPEVFVDRQIEANLNSQLQQLAAQGIDPRSLKLDWDKIRESQKERAERDVRASLILDKISEREAIAATQEDVDREVQRYARQQREAVAVVRAKLQKDGTINRIVGQIRTEKTLSFLFDKARKEAPKPGELPPDMEEAVEVEANEGNPNEPASYIARLHQTARGPKIENTVLSNKRKSKGNIWNYKPSPFVPYEQRASYRTSQFFIALLELIKSGISPGRGDSKTWYVRAFRLIGGITVILLLVYGLIVNFIDRAHGR